MRLNRDDRSYRFLAPISGVFTEFAIEPLSLRNMANRLRTLLNLAPTSDYLVGFAASGIALATTMSLETGIPLVIAYEMKPLLGNEITWVEPDSVDKDMYVYGGGFGTNVILVDDESDSGRTLENAVIALRRHGVNVSDAGSYYQLRKRGRQTARDGMSSLGLTLKSVVNVDINSDRQPS